MSANDWRPTATQAQLTARAQLNADIRGFFASRGVLEVETPLLSHAIGTDPNLHPIAATWQSHPHAASHPLYLQTSPEFAMKRLLAAGSGPIYQLGKAFRNGETGARHNPEFTMLEWYRPGFTLEQLMDEVEELVGSLLGATAFRRIAYRELFVERAGLDPFATDDNALRARVRESINLNREEGNRDTLLQLLYAQVIEPSLQDAIFIYDWPPSQAALARVNTDGSGLQLARRFELVIGGMEIANGYDELADPLEQRRRFSLDRAERRLRALPEYPSDERLLAALDHGLPSCAGVALGVDRLLMLRTGARTIDDVLTFPHARA